MMIEVVVMMIISIAVISVRIVNLEYHHVCNTETSTYFIATYN